MKKIIGMLGVLLVGVVTTGDARLLNRIVATVDGKPITEYQLEQFIEERIHVLPAQAQPSRKEALEAMITDRLVEREIEDQEIQVRDEDIDRYIQRILGENEITEAQLERAIAQQGLSLEDYRKRVRSEVQKMQLLNREIRSRVNVTPEEVKRQYESIKDEKYRKPAKVHLRQILLRLDPNASESVVETVMSRAAEVRRRIVEDDEPFAEVAKEVSEGPTASDGGDLGDTRPEQLLTKLQDTIENLDEGEVSEPVRTELGVHLVLLEKQLPVAYTPLEEVADGIREKLYSKALESRYERWLREDLWERHYVEIQLEE